MNSSIKIMKLALAYLTLSRETLRNLLPSPRLSGESRLRSAARCPRDCSGITVAAVIVVQKSKLVLCRFPAPGPIALALQ